MTDIRKYRIVFWDFDGVIKDSVDVKTNAFVSLFEPFGEDIADRVRKHHEANGGMSRFAKFPVYLEWAGIEPSSSRVEEYCNKFSAIVLQSVIDSPWVQGAEEFLHKNATEQTFIVVSATPQEELLYILKALKLDTCFSKVFGAPVSKTDAISESLKTYHASPDECLMIGDALADWNAAQANNVPFLLRTHDTNTELFSQYTGPSIRDFTEL